MKTSYILFAFVSIIATTLAWRSQSSSGSSGITIGERGPKRVSGERHKLTDHHSKKEDTSPQHFNIGLIVPHTNFGKREYQRAIRQVIRLPMRTHSQHSLGGMKCFYIHRRKYDTSKLYRVAIITLLTSRAQMSFVIKALESGYLVHKQFTATARSKKLLKRVRNINFRFYFSVHNPI